MLSNRCSLLAIYNNLKVTFWCLTIEVFKSCWQDLQRWWLPSETFIIIIRNSQSSSFEDSLLIGALKNAGSYLSLSSPNRSNSAIPCFCERLIFMLYLLRSLWNLYKKHFETFIRNYTSIFMISMRTSHLPSSPACKKLGNCAFATSSN